MEITDNEFYNYIGIKNDLEKNETNINSKLKFFNRNIHTDTCNIENLMKIFEKNENIKNFIINNEKKKICDELFKIFQNKKDEILSKLGKNSESVTNEPNISNEELIQNIQNLLDILFFRVIKLLEIISKKYPTEFKNSIQNLQINDKGYAKIEGGMGFGFIKFFIVILITIFNMHVKANILKSFINNGAVILNESSEIITKTSENYANQIVNLVSDVAIKTTNILDGESENILKEINNIKTQIITTNLNQLSIEEKEKQIELNNELYKLKKDYSVNTFTSSIINSAIIKNKEPIELTPLQKNFSELLSNIPMGEQIASFNSMFSQSLNEYWTRYCIDIGDCIVAETTEDMVKLYINPYIKEILNFLDIFIPELEKFANRPEILEYNNKWLDNYSKNIGTGSENLLTTILKKNSQNFIKDIIPKVIGATTSFVLKNTVYGFVVGFITDKISTKLLNLLELPTTIAHYTHLTLNTAKTIKIIATQLNELSDSNTFKGITVLAASDYCMGMPISTIIKNHGKELTNVIGAMIMEWSGLKNNKNENIESDKIIKEITNTTIEELQKIKISKSETEYSEIVDNLLFDSIQTSSEVIGLSNISKTYFDNISKNNIKNILINIAKKILNQYISESKIKVYDDFLKIKTDVNELIESGEFLGGYVELKPLNKIKKYSKKKFKKNKMIKTIKKYSK